jgi:Arc/MetJ-type ribon-helix-helix transcriptional regulator
MFFLAQERNRMSSAPSHENEAIVQEEIARGTYRDRAEVVNAGLDLHRQRRELTDRLANSRRQLDAGEYTDFDGPGLRELFADLKRRAKANAQ